MIKIEPASLCYNHIAPHNSLYFIAETLMSVNLGVSEAVRRSNNCSCRATCAKPLMQTVPVALPLRSCWEASKLRNLIFILFRMIIFIFFMYSCYFLCIFIYYHFLYTSV